MTSLGGCWLVTVVLLVAVDYCQACSCALSHPQDYYCSADFVIKAAIRPAKYHQDIPETHTRIYNIRVIKELKVSSDYLAANTSYLYTADHSAECGMFFQPNKKYLISGRVSNGKLQTNLCDYNGLWTSLTKWQRKGFSKLYKDTCDCKVQECFSDNCYAKNTSEGRADMCILDFHTDRDLCYMKHSRCSRRGDGDCHWNKTGQFRKCRKAYKERANSEP